LTIDSIQRRSALYEAHGFRKDFEEPAGNSEYEMLARADGIIAIQDDEARLFKNMLPRMPVITVPHPVRLEHLPSETIIPGTLLFIGGSAAHNVDGVHWFIREVLPQVVSANPSTILEVAGAVADSVQDHPAVRKLGHVKDLRSLYKRAQICVAPLRFGTGLKIKVVEAMGFGRPVVATPIAAEGFGDLPEALAVVELGPIEMADGILRLMADPELRHECVVRQTTWVRRHVLPEVALAPLLALTVDSTATAQSGSNHVL
jgi:succinoglycan biosynthesis protein ExoO